MENPEDFIINEIGSRFTLKEKSIGIPFQYLGNTFSLVNLENGNKYWSYSSSQYVHNAGKNTEDHLAKKGERLPAR